MPATSSCAAHTRSQPGMKEHVSGKYAAEATAAVVCGPFTCGAMRSLRCSVVDRAQPGLLPRFAPLQVLSAVAAEATTVVVVLRISDRKIARGAHVVAVRCCA